MYATKKPNKTFTTRNKQATSVFTSFSDTKIRGYSLSWLSIRDILLSLGCFRVQGGVIRISSDRDDRMIFLGLKFSISGFFWVGKFLQVLFWVAWFKQDFFGYSKLMFLFFVSYHLMLSENFYGLEIQHGSILSFVGNTRDYLGFYFCPHSTIPVTWNPEYPPGFKVAGYSNSRSSLQWTASESF